MNREVAVLTRAASLARRNPRLSAIWAAGAYIAAYLAWQVFGWRGVGAKAGDLPLRSRASRDGKRRNFNCECG